METQWRAATSALNTNKNTKKLKDLSGKLSDMSIKLVSLKKENQLMKERMHFNLYDKPDANVVGKDQDGTCIFVIQEHTLIYHIVYRH
jgi:hypothetical protein